MNRSLGVCYYPEHWPKEKWADDARRMADIGLTWVRIGEFAWSLLEPKEGEYQFDWLDEAIETLGSAGLKVVLGTPTATPPRWVVDKFPDMLAVDANGAPRKFGSRRHYCFSHLGYKRQCAKIVEVLAKRYGRNPHIAAWQTDNEYGCHDTIISYSDPARLAFQDWLRSRYLDEMGEPSIDHLNQAWGNVFWSMIYDNFDQIELPNLTVTEPNPAHSLAFRRFSSDQVVAFNKVQTDIIRQYSDAPISHNYMGRIIDFDHFKVGQDLDIATWDSYPIGFLADRVDADIEHKKRFARQGDPDFQAFHHDLYRAVGRERWWVMEQQPGPVNWAPYNPDPLPGMVRLWTWEAFAHGAEAVCYFRWRQAHFAQEQLHAGLLRPDDEAAPALEEARQVAQEITASPQIGQSNAKVALIFDYDADAMWHIQPHGVDSESKPLTYFGLVFDTYRALRKLGLSIDIVPPTQRSFSQYKLICAPGLVHMAPDLIATLQNSDAHIILGPRSAARDVDYNIHTSLPPNIASLEIKIIRLDSIHPQMSIAIKGDGQIQNYREILETKGDVLLETDDNNPVLVRQDNSYYLAAFLDPIAWQRVFKTICEEIGLETIELPEGVRIRDTKTERFWFNYDEIEHEISPQLKLNPISVVRIPL